MVVFLLGVKALQDKCVAGEGVIHWLRKGQDIQNKEAVCTLNKELMAVTEKLKQESILQEKV